MASFSEKHKDTSAPEQPTLPAPDAYPPDPPAAVFPQPQLGCDIEDFASAKQLDDAFRSIGDANHGVQKYEGSKSLKILNKAGTSIAPERVLSMTIRYSLCR